MLQSTGKYKEEGKIIYTHAHFGAVITGAPAVLYEWTEQLSDRVPAKTTFFQPGVTHICRSKQFSASFSYSFYINMLTLRMV